jgi:hypothetical protein
MTQEPSLLVLPEIQVPLSEMIFTESYYNFIDARSPHTHISVSFNTNIH